MKIVKTSKDGLEYLNVILKSKQTVVTKACLWGINHNSPKRDVSLKLGRYKKNALKEELDLDSPKSELTLNDEEFHNLLTFISENYEPFKQGIKKYIPIDDKLDFKDINAIKAIFENPDKQKLLDFILKNKILPHELILNLHFQSKNKATTEFEGMLSQDLVESKWQSWFKENHWVLGSDFVRIVDERDIDTKNISDYLMQAYDGFLDIVEIKRPDGKLKFWADKMDHENVLPSSDLVKAITQATKYIYEVEREANSIKFSERTGNLRVIKPRCTLIFGRSFDWTEDQRVAYRILNSSYYNLSILTYDHVLDRAKRIIGLNKEKVVELEEF